jgi:hypothetical protein
MANGRLMKNARNGCPTQAARSTVWSRSSDDQGQPGSGSRKGA